MAYSDCPIQLQYTVSCWHIISKNGFLAEFRHGFYPPTIDKTFTAKQAVAELQHGALVEHDDYRADSIWQVDNCVIESTLPFDRLSW